MINEAAGPDFTLRRWILLVQNITVTEVKNGGKFSNSLFDKISWNNLLS